MDRPLWLRVSSRKLSRTSYRDILESRCSSLPCSLRLGRAKVGSRRSRLVFFAPSLTTPVVDGIRPARKRAFLFLLSSTTEACGLFFLAVAASRATIGYDRCDFGLFCVLWAGRERKEKLHSRRHIIIMMGHVPGHTHRSPGLLCSGPVGVSLLWIVGVGERQGGTQANMP